MRVDDDAVDLFGHRPVERTQPGLDVGDRHAALRGDQRAGERRVDVADRRRPGRRRCASSHSSNAIITRAVCTACEPEPTPRFTSGGGDAEVDEQRLRHRPVVVLAGVDEHRLDARVAQRPQQGRDLHEVRPRSGDHDAPHARFLSHPSRRAIIAMNGDVADEISASTSGAAPVPRRHAHSSPVCWTQRGARADLARHDVERAADAHDERHAERLEMVAEPELLARARDGEEQVVGRASRGPRRRRRRRRPSSRSGSRRRAGRVALAKTPSTTSSTTSSVAPRKYTERAVVGSGCARAARRGRCRPLARAAGTPSMRLAQTTACPSAFTMSHDRGSRSSSAGSRSSCDDLRGVDARRAGAEPRSATISRTRRTVSSIVSASTAIPKSSTRSGGRGASHDGLRFRVRAGPRVRPRLEDPAEVVGPAGAH